MNIFKLEVRNLRKSFIIATLSVSTIIFAMLAFYPAMQTESMKALAGAKMEGIDPAVLKAFGLSELADFTLLTVFFGYILQFITLAVMFVVTQRAAGLYIKEETDGTIEYLYAKPVSRLEIFMEKLLAHASLLIGMLLVFFVVTVFGYMAFGEYSFNSSVKEAALIYLSMLFVGLIFSAVGVLISTVLRSGKSVSGATAAVVFGSYILGIMSAVVDKLSFLVWFSPIDWMNLHKLTTEGMKPAELILGLIVIVLGMSAAMLRYGKKDLLT